MIKMANFLVQVQTYQRANVAYAQNLCPMIHETNKRFENFQNMTGNLGQTVTFDLQPRFTTTDSLVAQFQDAVQRVQSLTVDQQISVSYQFTAQEMIFNVEDYMKTFGRGATLNIGSKIESNVALNCATGPYRFYGDGVTQISTPLQLAQALALFRNYGVPPNDTKGFLSDLAIPGIVNSGLSQFALNRNNEEALSWQLGDFSRCEWFESNLLPVHVAGTEGTQGSTLTVVSVTTNASGAVTAITFSGTHAASDANSVLAYDRFQFQNGVAGQPNLLFLTFNGQQVSGSPVQFKATTNAASTGGSQVTVTLDNPLQSASGEGQNINNSIVAGMQVKVLPTHRAGMIYSGDSFFLAMPRLPDQVPFPTANEIDKDTGAHIRQYFGTRFGQNEQGMIHDAIWGSTVIADNSMAVIFPE